MAEFELLFKLIVVIGNAYVSVTLMHKHDSTHIEKGVALAMYVLVTAYVGISSFS
jgi:hypothetical protein